MTSKASTIAVLPMFASRSRAAAWAAAKNLACAITQTPLEEEEGASSFASQSSQQTVIPWSIDNRYYTAEVQVAVLELGTEMEALEDVAAIVTLVDANEPESVHKANVQRLGDKGWESEVGIVLALPGEANLDVYRENGWEVVTWGDLDIEEEEEEEEEEEDEEEEGEEGIERVREACMANMWPGLVRKDERAPTSNGTSTAEEHTIPTDEDEALALAFLTQLHTLEPPGTGELPLPSDPAALASLEAFLESQPDWPKEHGFDDDFSDFVSATTDAPPQSFDEDDADEGLFGEQEMQSLREQAERVRGIQDHDERRTQAAAVALAFSLQLEKQGI